MVGLSQVYPGELKKSSLLGNSFLICGHNKELHNKTLGSYSDFSEKEKVLMSPLRRIALNKITIGISRYNFYCLGEIVDYCNSFFKIQTNLKKNRIALFPIKDILASFGKYLDCIKKAAGARFVFTVIDPDFIGILDTLKLHSDGDIYKDRDLARFLGLLCEYTFIGPEQIVVDPFHRCNTNCVHCWNHAPTVDPGKEWKELMLDYDFFRRLIDDAANLKVDLMVFGGAGEPLMHPNIIEIFEYATKKGIKIIVSTNAINLTEKMTDRLMKCNLYEIICSLPAASNEIYWKVNPMHDKAKTFERIHSNLRYYSQQKKKSENKAILSMYHVIHSLNCHEINDMARMDVKLGVDIARFSLVRLQREFMHLKLNKEQMDSIKKDIASVENYFKGKPIILRNNIHFQIDNFIPETGEWSGKILEKWGCKLGWFFSLILGSGQMSMCCHVREVENLKNPGASFANTWLSKEYNDFRVKAKYIKDFKTTQFKNKVSLYDDKCENCDNHVTLITIEEKLKKYGLERFLKY